MAIYEITTDSLTAMAETTFAETGIRERDDLQRLLRDNIGVLSQDSEGEPDLLVIAEEFSEWQDSRRRIDLLAIDRDANLVVVELKRTEDGGHMDLQAIRYAAMISAMKFERAVEVFADHLGRLGHKSEDAEDLLLEFLNDPDEYEFAQEVRIILASAEFSQELTNSVLWLNDRQLDIRCVRLKPYRDGARTLLDVQQIIPLPEAATYQVQLREKQQNERASRQAQRQWNGRDWFCNVAPGPTRQWTDARKYGFISGGQGKRWGPRLKKLPVDSRVFAYMPGKGYVGVGIVTAPAVTVDRFNVEVDGQEMPILEAPLKARQMSDNAGDPVRSEYLVRVKWLNTCDPDQALKAKPYRGHVICHMSNAAVVDAAKEHFNLKSE